MAGPQRIRKINELIKRELGKIILKEIGFPRNILVTITFVEANKDLGQSKVFISVIPQEKIEDILKVLEKNVYYLQQILNKRLKMRPVPKIRFLEDKGLKKAQRVEQILEKIKEK